MGVFERLFFRLNLLKNSSVAKAMQRFLKNFKQKNSSLKKHPLFNLTYLGFSSLSSGQQIWWKDSFRGSKFNLFFYEKTN